MSDDGGMFPKVITYGIVADFSREMLLAHGAIEPTPEEAAKQEASRLRYEQRRRGSWATYDAVRPMLAAIHDPIARAVLDLHHTATVEAPLCEGCDMDGFDAERPEWPCRTVQVVAAHYGIELPDPMDLWRRPDPADRTDPTGTAAGGEGSEAEEWDAVDPDDPPPTKAQDPMWGRE